ncbi:MAG TPA: type II 3-dehydroquinate dehydratase [Polyangiaceae bacterium]|nr:type II 3-dehydroquinate dehydratase [Polyangiaceae bacterium]
MAQARSRRGAKGPRARSPRSSAPRRRRPASLLRILVVSGPNLDRLGKREPEIYGKITLKQIHSALAAAGKALEVEVDCRQSNHEGLLIDWVNAAGDERFDGILINPGALTHTSYALLDSLKGCGLPAVEVHISNPDAREAFRRRSRIAPACLGRVAGFREDSYLLALEGLVRRLRIAANAEAGA